MPKLWWVCAVGLIPKSGVPEGGREDNVQRRLKLGDTDAGLELLTSFLRIHQKNNPKLEFKKGSEWNWREGKGCLSLCVTLPREKNEEGKPWGSFAES